MLPTVKLKDASKYGTYVNQKRIGDGTILKSGDCVKFGSDKSKFR
jgi:pSer/pThr/pTyr-binding forkhead associated (FHA) protein